MRHFWVLFGIGSIGAAAFALAAFQIIKTLIFLRASRQVVGTVVRLARAQRRSDTSVVAYLPIVWFQTPDNQTFEIAGKTAAAPPNFEVGQRVRVNYLPREPDKARIQTFLEMWYPVIISAIVGTVTIAVAAGLYFDS